jgi:hypothetical protein
MKTDRQQIGRQTGRERQTGRQAGRQGDRQAERPTDRETDLQTNSQSDRQTRKTGRQAGMQNQKVVLVSWFPLSVRMCILVNAYLLRGHAGQCGILYSYLEEGGSPDYIPTYVQCTQCVPGVHCNI